MTSESTRKEIWQAYWDSVRMARYYQVMSERYRILNFVTMLILLFFGTGAALSLLANLPAPVQQFLGACLAMLSIWTLLAKFAAKAAIAHTISFDSDVLAQQFSRLFASVDRQEIAESEAERQLTELCNRLRQSTFRSGDAEIAINEKVNERASKDAAKTLRLRYA